MTKYINSIIETIHNTPLLRLNNLEKKYNLKNKIFVKLEYLNPFGSIKDRIVLSMIEDAEKRGKITPAKNTIIESTSGNTGIALASVGRLKGYRVVIVMSEDASIERRKIIKHLGAELVLVPSSMSRLEMFEEVKRLTEENDGYYWLNQYANKANPEVHYKNTAQEIWQDLDGNVDIFVSGLGTGGTVSGVGKYLKTKNSELELIGVEPKDKAHHTIEGLQPVNNTKDGFVPEVMNLDLMDEVLEVENEDAFVYSRELSSVEGVTAGISSGASLKAVLEIDKKHEDKNIVFIAQDNFYRYLSTGLFKE
jgi:cysteine synthase